MDPYLQWLSWLLLAAAVIIISEIWRKNRGVPPGPIGLPIVGYYPFLKKDIYAQFAEFRERYGDIFSFKTAGGDLVIIPNGSAIKEMFVDRAEEFFGRAQQLNVLNYFDGGHGIAQSEGADWKEKRKFFLTSAKNFGLGKIEFQDYIHDLIRSMLDDMRQNGKEPFNVREKVVFVTGNAIAKIICDKKFEKDDPEFLSMVKAFDHIIGGGVPLLFLAGFFFRMRLMFSKAGRTGLSEVKKMRSVISKIVEEHIRTFDPFQERDFIDAYLNQLRTLEARNQLRNSSFSMDALKSITMNMLLEGTESTGSTIAGFIKKLSQHPEAQKKAQEEIDEVVGQHRLPSWTDRQNMPYLEALILELFRAAMFFNLTTFYSNFEETYVRGYRIPKRSLISLNFWSINNDPKLFPNPSEFDPGRFLGPDGKKIKRENSVGFGVGKRTCVGEGLAQMEIFLILGSLLQNFTIRPGKGDFEVCVEPRNIEKT